MSRVINAVIDFYKLQLSEVQLQKILVIKKIARSLAGQLEKSDKTLILLVYSSVYLDILQETQSDPFAYLNVVGA